MTSPKKKKNLSQFKDNTENVFANPIDRPEGEKRKSLITMYLDFYLITYFT